MSYQNMLVKLRQGIAKLPGDHPFRLLDDWHLKQIIRQMKLRAVTPRLPPRRQEEIYKGQGRILTNLYILLQKNREDDLVEFLLNCSVMDMRRLMWQRFTTTSTTDTQTIPPTGRNITDLALTHRDRTELQLQQVQQACDEDYWGLVIEYFREKRTDKLGTDDLILDVIGFFLDEFTWWNTFTTEDHVLYEIRDRTGHGLCIDMDRADRIIFLEP